mgnify:CR=1 FL=1|jgi:hypothetical protein
MGWLGFGGARDKDGIKYEDSPADEDTRVVVKDGTPMSPTRRDIGVSRDGRLRQFEKRAAHAQQRCCPRTQTMQRRCRLSDEARRRSTRTEPPSSIERHTLVMLLGDRDWRVQLSAELVLCWVAGPLGRRSRR